ncbi:MAG: type II secretion system F family protein [Candidatus Taylorbacteria bacterium]
MSKFIFKAKKSSGEVYSSVKEAKDRYDLYHMLREDGTEVISVKEKKNSVFGADFFKLNINIPFLSGRVKPIEKINMARNLGSMLEAGLPLSRALGVIIKEARNASLKKVLVDINTSVDGGQTLAKALVAYPKVFSPLFVSMVHAGEQGGNLAESLHILAAQLESSYELERRIRGAMLYPAVIIGVMLIVGVLMFIFVVPTLMKTFLDLNVALPISTRILLNISDAIRYHGLFVAIILVIVGGTIYLWSKRASGKAVVHAMILKIPLIGSLVQEINAARTARTLSSLMKSGVGVVDSLEITASVVQNVHFRSVLIKARTAISKGDSMSKIFSENTKTYPVFLAEMLSVGEETGKVADMLSGVAHYYEEDVEQKTKDMSTIIEPFLIVFIGAAVAFFAISMISPMYSLVNVI